MRRFRVRLCVIDGLPETHATRDFARHMTCDAKILNEDEETGTKKCKYIRTAADHYSLAFTYGLMALGKVHLSDGGALRRKLEQLGMI
jgi:hypothetical protein